MTSAPTARNILATTTLTDPLESMIKSVIQAERCYTVDVVGLSRRSTTGRILWYRASLIPQLFAVGICDSVGD